MPNFADIINAQNKNILNENFAKATWESCNWRVSSSLDDNCLQSSLVYICKAATLVTPTTSDKTFKDRFY